jgi:hypothetical protein
LDRICEIAVKLGRHIIRCHIGLVSRYCRSSVNRIRLEFAKIVHVKNHGTRSVLEVWIGSHRA